MGETLKLRGYRMGINYGVNKVRFPPRAVGLPGQGDLHGPVRRGGSRQRAGRVPGGRRVREGGDKPVCVASPSSRMIREALRGQDRARHRRAKGIGAATAERFAAEGAHVVVADFDEAAANETAERIGGRGVRCDVPCGPTSKRLSQPRPRPVAWTTS